MGALGAADEKWCRSDGAEGPNGAVYAAGDDFLGQVKESF